MIEWFSISCVKNNSTDLDFDYLVIRKEALTHLYLAPTELTVCFPFIAELICSSWGWLYELSQYKPNGSFPFLCQVTMENVWLGYLFPKLHANIWNLILLLQHTRVVVLYNQIDMTDIRTIYTFFYFSNCSIFSKCCGFILFLFGLCHPALTCSALPAFLATTLGWNIHV